MCLNCSSRLVAFSHFTSTFEVYCRGLEKGPQAMGSVRVSSQCTGLAQCGVAQCPFVANCCWIAGHGCKQRPEQRRLDTRIYKTEMKFWPAEKRNSQQPKVWNFLKWFFQLFVRKKNSFFKRYFSIRTKKLQNKKLSNL